MALALGAMLPGDVFTYQVLPLLPAILVVLVSSVRTKSWATVSLLVVGNARPRRTAVRAALPQRLDARNRVPVCRMRRAGASRLSVGASVLPRTEGEYESRNGAGH